MKLTNQQAEWIDDQLRLLEDAIHYETGLNVHLTMNGADKTLEVIIDDIVRHVCDVLNIPIVLVLSASRKQRFVMARYVILQIIRMHYGSDRPSEIAKLFNRDRTTIIHAYNEIDALIETKNSAFLEVLNKCLINFKKPQNETANQD